MGVMASKEVGRGVLSLSSGVAGNSILVHFA